MKKQKQFNVQRLYSKRSGVYKFAQDKRSEASDGVYFFDPEKKYHKGDAFVIPNMASFIHDVSEHGNIGALKKRVFKLNPFQLLRSCFAHPEGQKGPFLLPQTTTIFHEVKTHAELYTLYSDPIRITHSAGF
jgi:hypothetical protein